jgi:hypothetical protein
MNRNLFWAACQFFFGFGLSGEAANEKAALKKYPFSVSVLGLWNHARGHRFSRCKIYQGES